VPPHLLSTLSFRDDVVQTFLMDSGGVLRGTSGKRCKSDAHQLRSITYAIRRIGREIS